MLPVDPDNPHRLPAPSPCRSCLASKIGWGTACIAMLMAAFLYFRHMTASAELKLEQNASGLAQAEAKALKNQLFAERIIAERQIAKLTAEANAPKTDTMIFAHLSPPETGATTPNALVVWLPARQTGVLFANQLPTPNDNEDLRLWLEEGNSGPVNAGVVTLGAGRLTKIEFKPAKPLGLAVRFTVTRERKAHTGAPSGPILLSGAP